MIQSNSGVGRLIFEVSRSHEVRHSPREDSYERGSSPSQRPLPKQHTTDEPPRPHSNHNNSLRLLCHSNRHVEIVLIIYNGNIRFRLNICAVERHWLLIITSVCLSVYILALVILQANPIPSAPCFIVICGPFGCTLLLHIFSRTARLGGSSVLNINCMSWFYLLMLSEKFVTLKKNSATYFQKLSQVLK